MIYIHVSQVVGLTSAINSLKSHLLANHFHALGGESSQTVDPLSKRMYNIYIYIYKHFTWSFVVIETTQLFDSQICGSKREKCPIHEENSGQQKKTKKHGSFKITSMVEWKENEKIVSIPTSCMVSCATTIFRWNCLQGIIALQRAYEGNYRPRRPVKQLVAPKWSCDQLGPWAHGYECYKYRGWQTTQLYRDHFIRHEVKIPICQFASSVVECHKGFERCSNEFVKSTVSLVGFEPAYPGCWLVTTRSMIFFFLGSGFPT